MVFFTILTIIFVKDDPTKMGLPSMDEVENRPSMANNNIHVGQALKSVMSNKRTWVISIAYIGLYTGYVVFLGTFGVSFLMQAYNIEKMQASGYVVSAILGSAVSGLVVGMISDHFKNRKIPLIISGLTTLIGWIILVYVRMPLGLLVPFLFVFGFCMSGFTMCWTVGNEVNDRRLSGIATGVVNCIGFLGAAVIPVIMGKILDNYKDMPSVGYEKAYLVLIVLIAVSVVATFFSTETHAKNIYEVK